MKRYFILIIILCILLIGILVKFNKKDNTAPDYKTGHNTEQEEPFNATYSQNYKYTSTGFVEPDPSDLRTVEVYNKKMYVVGSFTNGPESVVGEVYLDMESNRTFVALFKYHSEVRQCIGFSEFKYRREIPPDP